MNHSERDRALISRKARWAVAAGACLFLLVAGLYNACTPIYESPDELQHAAFVVWLAGGRGLPVVDPREPGPWAQEGTQPPLYYWLAATLLGGLPHRPAEDLATLNPYASVGDPLRPDNKSRVLHDLRRESWPYEPDVLFVHLARGLSSLMALGTLGAVYALGRITFPARPAIALGMAGLAAFLPQFLFLSASVNNDNLVILVASWTLVLMAAWLRVGKPPGWWALAGLGILLGLAALAKFSGLLLWPLAGGLILWLAWRQRRPAWLILAGALVFGLALATCGWWLVRNQHLYGDWTALSPHLAIIGARGRFPSRLGGLLAEFRGLRYSFWALFGWFNILVPEPFYRIVDALTILGLAGFLLFLARSLRRQPAGTGPILVMLVVWVDLISIALLRWTLLTPAGQGRLLYPALGALALFLNVGWAELMPRRLGRPLGGLALAAWIAWAALCPLLIIAPAYKAPQQIGALSDLAAVPANPLGGVQFGECCELAGYLPPDGPVHPGDCVPLTLVWRAVAPAAEDYLLFVHAVAADGRLVGQADTYHGGGLYPTSQWRPGEMLADTVHIPIQAEAAGPILVRFQVGLARPATGVRLPAYTPDGKTLEVLWAGEVALDPFQWPQAGQSPPADAVFEQQIRLAAISLPDAPVHAGETVTITLQWESLAQIGEDFTGFVHLVGPGGEDVAQDDQLPLDGRYPTRLWQEGIVVDDPYQLELPVDLEPGVYELLGGWYRPASGQRLAAVSAGRSERWQDDLVPLGALTVHAGTP